MVMAQRGYYESPAELGSALLRDLAPVVKVPRAAR